MNLARYCLCNAGAEPGKRALELVGPAGTVLEHWTYQELTDKVLSVAAGLQDLGLLPGDRVLLRIGHSSDFPLCFFGAIAGGFVPVPASSLLTESEVTTICRDSGARLVLHDGQTTLPGETTAVIAGPDQIRELKGSKPGSFADVNENDPAFLIYTSGTSGTPKGVLHAHRAAKARQPMYAGWYGLRAEDRLLHAGAFNWTYTLGAGLMDPWANGATSLVYQGPREPQLWPGILEASNATLFAAVPSLYRRILKYGEIKKTSFPLLRHGLTAGEALAPAIYNAWRETTGRELYEALGMSEISTYISSSPATGVRPGSPGKPQPGRKVCVLNERTESAEEAVRGETGLLAVHKSEPGLMLRYWNREAETKSAFKGDWFLTGDRACWDEDGYIWYEGRADDLLNSFGYRVAPEEVERVLAGHPDVAEVAVAECTLKPGVSVITAFVVPVNAASFNENDLADYAAQVLAEYKRPKAYQCVLELPRTASGKVRRKNLTFQQ
ncbi:acyl-CoA synthetase [Roseibium denhamense]|nr:acyl-CoA synthetase [Roseibium denhamense]MTI05320.1 acyl-CoA synthetase [Roseibium denhamense]